MSKTSPCTVLAITTLLLVASTFDTSVFAAVRPDPYANSTYRFSINPPSGWTVDDSGAFGTTVVFFGPTEANFRVNMNVVVESTSLTLSGYISAAKSQYPSFFTNYTLVSEGPRPIRGVDAYELVSTFTQGSFNIKNKQDVLVQNQKAYVVTSTALQSNYGTYSPAFDESVQTFQLTGQEFPLLTVIVIIAIVAGAAVGLTLFFMRRKDKVPPATSGTATSSPQL